MAHARRKFFELQEHGQSQIAGEALERIAALYGIEQEARELKAEARQALRETQAKPLLDDFKTWLLACRGKIPNGSSSAKAIDYTLKRWAALIHYLTDGNVPIDNNWIENQIRPIAIGRNYVQSAIMLSRRRRAARSAAPRPYRLRIIKEPAGTSTAHRSADSARRGFREARSRPRRAPSWPDPLRRSHASLPDSRARATEQ
jgi:hypothetical protein